MFQKAVDRYNAPIPTKLAVWGDIILIIGTTLDVTLATLEVPYGWLIAVTVLTAVGKALPKLATLYRTPQGSDKEIV